MTVKTYDKLSVKIIEEINKICVLKNIDIGNNSDSYTISEKIKDDTDINKIGEEIFNIASSSVFFSDLYARFYIYLIEQFPSMEIIFKYNFEKFSELFHNIEYCSPNDDYDKFCENNKKNDKRRALGLFYVNLMLKNAIEIDKVLGIIHNIQKYMLNEMKEQEKNDIVDELSELIFIMTTSIIKSDNNNILDMQIWKDIVHNIQTISKLKNSSYPSITNKTIFKHLDITDILA